MNDAESLAHGASPLNTSPDTSPDTSHHITTAVREHYGRIASTGGSCCGPSSCGTTESSAMSIPGREAGPADADLGLSCGAPLGFLDLRPGETVLDLGSGSGIDAFLAARAVAPEGRAIGVDMTPEMVERSRAIALREGIENVEFHVGRLEALPLPDASVDAVTSNCVLNLVPDKEAVAREIARVLRPGGRLVISDILLAAPLPAALEADTLAQVGCIAGAELREDCFSRLRAAGFSVEVLSDVDAGSFLDAEGAEEVSELLVRLGIRHEQVAGLVRSVTYRARRAG